MRKWAVFTVLVLALAGCATEENYKKIVQSWVGSTEQQLVATWGVPANSYVMNDGTKVLQYASERTVQTGGYTYTQPVTTYNTGSVYGYGGSAMYSGSSTTYVTKTTPLQTWNMSCVTNFTISKQGIVTNYSFQGNDCVATDPSE